jgi:RES domain-containing protein
VDEVDDANLVGLVDAIPPVRWQGSAWRHVAIGRPALSGEGARLMGGRWNPSRSFAVLYLGTTTETVVAEFHRLAARQLLAPGSFLPRTLYTYDVDLRNVLDLREAENRKALGLDIEGLAADDLSACQAVGEAAFACGREGIVAPSATGVDSVLAVFPERLTHGSAVRDVRAEIWETVPPGHEMTRD